MRLGARLAAVIALLALGACGKPLGTYRVDSARLVSPDEYVAIEQHATLPAAPMIRFEFSSDTDLAAVVESGNIYLHGDFCPFHDEYALATFGPFPDGKSLFTPENEVRHATRVAAGRYHYSGFLRIAAEANQFAPAYRLGDDARDLCLRIDQAGYYVTPSRSETFVLSHARIAPLLAEAARETDALRSAPGASK